MRGIIKIIHFHNGMGGGVLSVIRNILQYKQHPQIENHVIYTVNKDKVKDYRLPDLQGAASEQLFYYSANWNFYYTCRQLAKLLPDENAVIVAHDWLELGMVSNLGLQNPVVQFLHGNYEYYYELAIRNERSICKFLCVSPIIKETLVKKISFRETDVYYRNFPVPGIQAIEKNNDVLHLFFCVGDLRDPNKQFQLLPKINELLEAWKIAVNWTIVGKGYSKDEVCAYMNIYKNITVTGELDAATVFELLIKQDVLLLPSLMEGFPVVLIEAMKAGLVPLITDWEGATKELVADGETGYYLKPEDAIGYAQKIKSLHSNRQLLSLLSGSARDISIKMFDPKHNTKLIEDIIINTARPSNNKNERKKIYGSRLDNNYLPNFLVNSWRNYFSKIGAIKKN